MSERRVLFALPLAALAFAPWFVSNGSTMMAASSDVRCEIRSKKVSGGVELTSIAVADAAASGTYEFKVRKEGGGGTSNTNQGGDFSLRSGEEAVLGEVSLGLGDGATYTAELTLNWDGSEASCEAKYPK